MATEAPQDDNAGTVLADASEEKSAGGEAPKEMYTDEYIRLWEPLEPLDPDKMTPAHKRAILRKLYLRSAPVYDRLAEL